LVRYGIIDVIERIEIISERCCLADHTDRSTWTHHTHSVELHWLPVQRYIEFKLATLVFKTLHDTELPYLSHECRGLTPIVVSAHRLLSHVIQQTRTAGWQVVWCRRSTDLQQVAISIRLIEDFW